VKNATLPFTFIIAALGFVVTSEQAAQATDPNLTITISRTNQNVVLQWFGLSASHRQWLGQHGHI